MKTRKLRDIEVSAVGMGVNKLLLAALEEYKANHGGNNE